MPSSSDPAAEGNPFAATAQTDLQLEIGHVLFIDIVGYSKLLINEQHESLQELNRIVRGTDAFRSAEEAGKLIRLPTGDGMALVFTTAPDAPVRCALQASKALRDQPKLQVRMGVHSGAVSGTTDVNDRSNLAGTGLNVAQRVMDYGDPGHILLSKRVAEDLAQYRHWQPMLHDLGECEVKHGEVISIVNLSTAEIGNAEIPTKLRTQISLRSTASAERAPSIWSRRNLLLAVVLLLAVGATAWMLATRFARRTPRIAAATQNAPVVPAKSIAVLPFENFSSNPETAFFTDGVHDEILSNLAKVADLKVISRTSVMQYKVVRDRNLREIARQLGVAHILEGSVQRVGDRIRVNAQLIDARTDAHLWAQTYDRELADVFAIQSEISKTIADQLQAQISPREIAALSQPPTKDPVAEKLYAEARQLSSSGSNPDAKKALLQAARLLEEAIARDPHYLRAYSLLTVVHLDLYWQGFDHNDARRELARQVVEKAASFAPDAGEVHLARANYFYQGFRDYDHARVELELARATLPNNAQIPIFLASIDRRQGRWADALKNFERGLELDPQNFRYLQETAFTYEVLRRYPEANDYYQRALKIQPQDHFARTQLARLAFLERAEVGPLRRELSTILSEDPTSATEIANGTFNCALAERDSEAALRALLAIRPEGLRDPYNNSLWAREWFVGLAARSFGEKGSAQKAFTAAREIEAKTLQVQPDYAPAWSRLGLIEAGLGNKEAALNAGRRACALLPLSQDAWDGASIIVNLAMIYAWTDEKDLALEQLATAARIPNGVSYGELQLHPQWDALRGDPRFAEIVASLAPKDARL